MVSAPGPSGSGSGMGPGLSWAALTSPSPSLARQWTLEDEEEQERERRRRHRHLSSTTDDEAPRPTQNGGQPAVERCPGRGGGGWRGIVPSPGWWGWIYAPTDQGSALGLHRE